MYLCRSFFLLGIAAVEILLFPPVLFVALFIEILDLSELNPLKIILRIIVSLSIAGIKGIFEDCSGEINIVSSLPPRNDVTVHELKDFNWKNK